MLRNESDSDSAPPADRMAELLGSVQAGFAALEEENRRLRERVDGLSDRLRELEGPAADELVPFDRWVAKLSEETQRRLRASDGLSAEDRQRLHALSGIVDLLAASVGDSSAVRRDPDPVDSRPGLSSMNAPAPAAPSIEGAGSATPPVAAGAAAAPPGASTPSTARPTVGPPADESAPTHAEAAAVPRPPVRPSIPEPGRAAASMLPDITPESVLSGPTSDAPPHRVTFQKRRAIPGMEGVEYRPPGHLHEDDWVERHAPWLYDFIIWLNLERLERGLDRAAERTESIVGAVVEPIAPWVERVGQVGRRAGRSLSRATGAVVGAIPLPVSVRSWLWIGPQPALAADEPTIQNRMKSRYESMIWLGVIASTVAHFAIFSFWPELQAEDVSFTAEEITAIEMPPEIEVPPPPQSIARPATPVMATGAAVDEDITIAPTTFEQNPVEELPPPPEERVTDRSRTPTFTPFTVAPRMTNGPELARVLEQEYPTSLKNAGVGGTVIVWFFIDEGGRVQDTRVHVSSGYPQLDEAALAVADQARFTAALNGDQAAAVWIQFPIEFRVR